MSIANRFMKRKAGIMPAFSIDDVVLVTGGMYLVDEECVIRDIAYNYFKHYFVYLCDPIDSWQKDQANVHQDNLKLVAKSPKDIKPKFGIGDRITCDYGAGKVLAIEHFDHGIWYYKLNIENNIVGYPEDAISPMPEAEGEVTIA